MQPNPFSYGPPLFPPGVALQRDALVIQMIADGLLRGEYYTLVGPRFSGTTTLAHDILRTAKDRETHCLSIYIDVQQLPGDVSEANVFGYLAESVCMSLLMQGETPSASCPDFHSLLLKAVSGRPARLILAFDNIDSTSLPFSVVRALARCARNLYNQRLTQLDYHKISVMMSGSQSLYSLSTGVGSPFNIAERYGLRDMKLAETVDLVEAGEALCGVHFEAEARHRIHTATQGHRYFVQRICHMAVAAAQVNGDTRVNTTVIDQFIDILTTLDYKADRCLTYCMDVLLKDGELCEVVQRLLSGERVTVTSIAADAERLDLTGIVRTERGYYSLRNEIYGRFLAQHRDLLIGIWQLHRTGKEQTRRLVGMHRVALSNSSALHPDEALQAATRAVLGVTEAELVAVYLDEPGATAFHLGAVATLNTTHTPPEYFQPCPIAQQVLETKPTYLNAAEQFCEGCDLARGQGTCRWLPLAVGNDMFGVVAFAYEEGRVGRDSFEQQVAEMSAAHLAAIVAQTRLLETLQRVGRIPKVGATLQDLLQTIVDETRRSLNVPLALLRMADTPQAPFHIVAHAGNLPTAYRDKIVLAGDTEPMQRFFQRREPAYIKDISTSGRYAHRTIAQQLGWCSLLTMPLHAEVGPIGMLEAYSYELWEPTERQRAALRLLAQQAALTIEAARTHERLQQAYTEQHSFIELLAHHWFGAPTYAKNDLDLVLEERFGPLRLNRQQRQALVNARTDLIRYIDHLTHLRDLLRLDQGRLTPIKQPVSLDEVAHKVVQLYTPWAEEKGVTVVTQFSPIPPLEVDPGMMEAVLANLVENAIKFSPANSVVTVEIWGDSDQAHFAVDDQGPGVPSEARARLGERFYRATTHPDGAGLGLHFVMRYVELHAGRVMFPAKATPGFRVEVALPRRATPSAV